MSKMMKAAVVRAFGKTLQIEEVAVPAPGMCRDLKEVRNAPALQANSRI